MGHGHDMQGKKVGRVQKYKQKIQILDDCAPNAQR